MSARKGPNGEALPKPGDWILCKDPHGRVSYGDSRGGVFKVERIGRVNVIASCDVRFAPGGPIFHQEHRIPLAHVVRVVPPEEVQPLHWADWDCLATRRAKR